MLSEIDLINMTSVFECGSIKNTVKITKVITLGKEPHKLSAFVQILLIVIVCIYVLHVNLKS